MQSCGEPAEHREVVVGRAAAHNNSSGTRSAAVVEAAAASTIIIRWMLQTADTSKAEHASTEKTAAFAAGKGDYMCELCDALEASAFRVS
jgi:hypothetical protein